ncbi:MULTISPECIES: DUF6221 family protein [Cellulosimicrobium]|uniref:Uncharacterized protein n=1 Tax=Cellulosimicrobium protaetiae TaxID=2587808 RepID=A0A6M5UNB4_9MICO|nr:DUF6221 family protein [Cellulosimicrobium protaetiae]QJW38688.1 hypothetical protein FIC82_020075 [Cellulosimicrobium protaetiae]
MSTPDSTPKATRRPMATSQPKATNTTPKATSMTPKATSRPPASTSTDALLTFLRARLDEAEAVALAVPVGVINRPPAHLDVSKHAPDGGRVLMGTGPDFEVPTPEHAAHIAAHDPAAVMADVAAKRLIVDAHADGDTDPHVTGWVLRCLASAYAEHRDYDRAWAL